ncbi:MAG: signal peptidase II [Clostridiales bacterium]|nr:signal peptidase II [Clostridiales bacterium]
MLNTVFILLFCFFVAEDIFLKQLVVKLLQPVGEVSVINNFFYLTYVENSGMAFGLLSGARWLFVAFTVIILAVIFAFFLKCRTKSYPVLLRLSAVMIASGAVGNLIDRIRLGYVVDYLHFVFFGHSFAVFNFADILVVCGTGLLCLYILFEDKSEVDKK